MSRDPFYVGDFEYAMQLVRVGHRLAKAVLRESLLGELVDVEIEQGAREFLAIQRGRAWCRRHARSFGELGCRACRVGRKR